MLEKRLHKEKSESPAIGSMRRLMLSSLLGILLPMFCLAGMTWAWFTTSVQTTANSITAAVYDVDILVEKITDTDTDKVFETIKQIGGGYQVEMKIGSEYKITMKQKEGTTATKGWCRLNIVENDSFNRDYYVVVNNEDTTFYLNTSAESLVLNVYPSWGKHDDTLTEYTKIESDSLALREGTDSQGSFEISESPEPSIEPVTEPDPSSTPPGTSEDDVEPINTPEPSKSPEVSENPSETPPDASEDDFEPIDTPEPSKSPEASENSPETPLDTSEDDASGCGDK